MAGDVETGTRGIKIDILQPLKKNKGGCAGCCLFTVIFAAIYLATCWGMVQPTEYGLLRSGMTGTVDYSKIYEGGRHFIGWGNNFLYFPAKRTTVTVVVDARTGPGDGSSGGQPVTLDVSFQYAFEKANIPDVYSTFGMSWETSYERYAAQAITNAAQSFTPFAFWQKRASVEESFEVAVAEALAADGNAKVEGLQMVAVSFDSTYEETITAIQLQEQAGVTRRFQLQSTAVEQEISVLQAETDAQVTTIAAEGTRAAAVLINAANNAALLSEQTAKAESYAEIRQHFNWTQPQFLEYIRFKALNSQSSQSNIKVAMAPVGSTA